MQVSVRELKNNLSKYLHQVAKGETLIVTSHRHPLAKIIAISNQSLKLQNYLQLEGIKWNGKKPQGGGAICPEIFGQTAAEYVLEDR